MREGVAEVESWRLQDDWTRENKGLGLSLKWDDRKPLERCTVEKRALMGPLRGVA